MGVSVDGLKGGNAGGNIDHRAPLREPGALLVILGQTVGQLIEADGDDLAREAGQRLRTLIDLDTGNRTGLFDQLNQRGAVLGFLPDGLVVQDDAGNAVAHRFGGTEQELTVVAPVVLGVLHADGVKTALDRSGRLIRSKNALAGRHHRICDLVQFTEVHRGSPSHHRPAASLHVISATLAKPGDGTLKTPYRTRSTSTPGSALPSIHSRKAPPAAET